jgi:hypothetical protein
MNVLCLNYSPGRRQTHSPLCVQCLVEPLVKLKKVDDWARMCYIVGYKYGRGGYRVGIQGRRRCRDQRVMFFEEGMPPPILAEPHMPPWCAMVNACHALVPRIMVQLHTWTTCWQASHRQSCQCSPMGSLITLWLYLSAGQGIANVGSGQGWAQVAFVWTLQISCAQSCMACGNPITNRRMGMIKI